MRALASRAAVQARDIFDLYILSSQYPVNDKHADNIEAGILSKARERIFEVDFEQFRDTVAAYLSAEDRELYGKPGSWEDVRLKVIGFIEEIGNPHA